jgi:hypothetical protein
LSEECMYMQYTERFYIIDPEPRSFATQYKRRSA